MESAFELLQDITFDSIFPEKQIENERGVILEEMSLYRDSPEDAIQDEFDDVIFRDHPLGKNILGTPSSVKSFQRKDFQDFLKTNMNTEGIVFSCVGNVPLKKVTKLAEKYFGAIPHVKAKRERVLFKGYTPSSETIKRNITQAHCAIGTTAFALGDKRRLPFFMLINILGGPGMNSRLNLALREKYGFVYNIEASYNPYSDTGLFAIFYGTELSQVNRSKKLIAKELKLLREKPLGTLQLHKAKEQLVGQLAMAEENNASLMLMMGKSILDMNKVHSLEGIIKNIRSISSEQLIDIANEALVEDQLSYLTFLPKS
jgi:predicted Zn-dependent peptidase